MGMMETVQVKEIKMYGKPSVYLKLGAKKFKQITHNFSDNENGRCAMGVILSMQGWDGKSDVWVNWGIRSLARIITLNDESCRTAHKPRTFSEIVDWLELNDGETIK